MRLNEVASRYAKALLAEARLTQSEKNVVEELRVLAQKVFSDSQVLLFLKSPLISDDRKSEVILGAILNRGLSKATEDFIKLLAAKGRGALLPEIAEAFVHLLDVENNVRRGTVRSVTVLSPEERKRIEETVTKVTKKRVILNYVEDPTLIGGLIAQVGGWTFDDSLKSHLRRMNEDLKRRAN